VSLAQGRSLGRGEDLLRGWPWLGLALGRAAAGLAVDRGLERTFRERGRGTELVAPLECRLAVHLELDFLNEAQGAQDVGDVVEPADFCLEFLGVALVSQELPRRLFERDLVSVEAERGRAQEETDKLLAEDDEALLPAHLATDTAVGARAAGWVEGLLLLLGVHRLLGQV